MAGDTSTLMASEVRWAPVTWATCTGAACVGAALIMRSLAVGAGPQMPLRVLCCLLWLVLTGTNALYAVRHKRPTVGMMPVAAISLLPCSIIALTSGVMEAFCAVLALLSGAVAVFVGVWFLRLVAVYAHRAQPADDCLAIVLGGAVRHGHPCRTLRRRLDVAYRLCAEKPDRLLILTGGRAPGTDVTEASVMASYLTARGLDGACMLLETAARNTAENISLSASLIRAQGLDGRQICVVTSDYHLYRAVQEGHRQGIELVPLPAPTPPSSALQQWCREVLTVVSKR